MFDNKYILRSSEPIVKIPDLSIGEYIWKNLQQLNQDSTCIIEALSGEELTVRELISQANSIAMALIHRGIEKSDKICILCSNTIQHSIVLFASYFLGITLRPISFSISEYELKNELQTMGSIFIFTSLKFIKLLDQIIKDFNENKINEFYIKLVVVTDGIYSNCSSFIQLINEGKDQILDAIPYFKIDPKKDLFAIISSSGTSGPPKAVMLSHFSFLAILLGLKPMPECKTAALFAHFGHLSGLVELLWRITSSITAVIYEDKIEELIFKSIEKYKISLIQIVPVFGPKLIDGEYVNKFDLSSLKFIISYGSAFPSNIAKAIIDKYGVLFREAYGMTEYIGITDGRNFGDLEYVIGSVGRVSRNTELKIIDLTTGQSLGPNIDGEICARGHKMFSGYLNNTKATNETIDSDGWLHTGDVGHYDENERIFITDRIKEMIKYLVLPISPTEIENFLLTHECVAEVAVVGVKHKFETQWPRAYVKLKADKSVSEDELKTYVSESLSFTKQLRAGVVFVDEIPRTIIGKIDRKYFKQLVANEIIH